jgi:radical SAM protein
MDATVAAPRTRLARPVRDDFRRSPLLVFYELTQACDLVCRHCRACAQVECHQDELTPAQARLLIDQLTEFPVPPMLVLTGGDPLKRPDLDALIAQGVRAGLEVSITPSSTPLLTAAAVGRLQSLGVSRMAISLDGADPATHDANRGVPGSFRRGLEALREARRIGLPTQVNTTLMPSNLDQIDRMAELLAELEIVMWSVFFLVPVGRACDMPRLSAPDCELAFARLWRQSQQQQYVIKTTEAPHYRRYLLQQRTRGSKGAAQPQNYMPMGVNDGKGVMFVSHRGYIQPSGFLPVVCGVFPQDHLVATYQYSPIFQALRDSDRLQGKCRGCEYRHVCGGSRARAYATSESMFAEEPDCLYVPEAASRT